MTECIIKKVIRYFFFLTLTLSFDFSALETKIIKLSSHSLIRTFKAWLELQQEKKVQWNADFG